MAAPGTESNHCPLRLNDTLPCYLCIALTNDLVNDVRKRCGRVDDHTVFRNGFFRLIQARSDVPFRCFSAPVSRVHCHSLINPPVHGVKVNLKDKNAIEQIDEL